MTIALYVGCIVFCILGAVAYVWFELASDAGKTRAATIAFAVLSVVYLLGPVCSSAVPKRKQIDDHFESETQTSECFAEDISDKDLFFSELREVHNNQFPSPIMESVCQKALKENNAEGEKKNSPFYFCVSRLLKIPYIGV